MANRKSLENMLLEMLGDPQSAAGQADVAQAAGLARQTIGFRQRMGAAAVQLQRARSAGADKTEIADLENRFLQRADRLRLAMTQLTAANVKRPAPLDDVAQVFARASGPAEAPPLTLAALSSKGEVVAQATASDTGIAHLTAQGDLKKVILQISDKEQRVIYRSTAPVTVDAGTVLYVDADVGPPEPEDCPVPTSVTMPDLLGQSRDTAAAHLMQVGVEDISTKTQPGEGTPGIVIDQNPNAGTVLKSSPKVTLTLRIAPEGGTDTVEVPNVTGAPVNVARERLKVAGFDSTRSFQVDVGEADIVLEQNPEGGKVAKPGSSVALVISAKPDDAPDTVVIPDVIGKPETNALEIMKAADLSVDISRGSDPKQDAGIIEQSPPAGTTVQRGATVKLVMNTPPVDDAKVVVPNLIGRSMREAETILDKLSLEPDTKSRINADPKDLIAGQSPEAGAQVDPDSTITLKTSKTKPTDTPPAIKDLVQAMARDPRAEVAIGDRAKIAAVLRSADVTDIAGARELAAQDPEVVRSILGVGTRKSATTVRAIMRKALKDQDK